MSFERSSIIISNYVQLQWFVIILIFCFQDYELLVLSRLKWDLSAITPHDFLEQILSRLPIDHERAQTIKRHAQTFIAICATGKPQYTS